MKITHTIKVKASKAIKSSTYIYEFGIDDGDAESGPLVHDNRYDFEATSLEEAQRMGDEMFSGEEGFVGGHAREATQEELDEIAKWNEIEDHYIFDDGNVYPKDDIESATQEEMQQAFDAYQKKQAELSKQLDDLQNDQLSKFNKATKPKKKGLFRRAFGSEDAPVCRKVAEDENTIEYVVSSEDISSGTKWMGQYLTASGQLRHVYFKCATDDWNEAVQNFEDSIPESYQACKLVGKAPDNIEADETFTYIESATRTITGHLLGEIQSQLHYEIHRYLVDVGGFDEESVPGDITNIPADDIFKVDVYKDDSGAVVAEVRAELGYESMDNLADILNDKVIQKYDPDAYFEQVDSGIMEAWMFMNNSVTGATRWGGADVDDLRDKYLEPDEKDVEMLDDFEQDIVIDIDTDIDMSKDGSYDYDSLDFVKNPDSRNGDYYVEVEDLNKEIKLADYTTIAEDLDEMLIYKLPDAEGKHHISGQAHIIYNISGLAISENGVFDYNFNAEFDKSKSHIDKFKFD